MSESAAKLMEAVLQLPEPERLAIADAIYDSLPRPPGVLSEDDPNLDAVLARRLADFESGKTKGIPGDEFFRRLREKAG